MQCYLCGTELNEKQPVQYVIVPMRGQYKYVCGRCKALFNTCNVCVHGAHCAYQEDNSGLPKQVAHEVRQGNMVMQTVGYNPELVKKTCAQCKCNDAVEGVDGARACNREFATCVNCEMIDELKDE